MTELTKEQIAQGWHLHDGSDTLPITAGTLVQYEDEEFGVNHIGVALYMPDMGDDWTVVKSYRTFSPDLPSPPVSGKVWPEKRLPEGWWVHELKTWPDAFDAMHDGRKLFEFRKHDRDYRVGDQILSRRFDPDVKDYTGEVDKFEITFMLVAGQYGVPDGFCVMGVKPYSPLTNEPVGVTEPLTLKDFGYAPGNYMVKCADCGESDFWLDKRAWRCEKCAQARLSAAIGELG